jgi:hypothetical protein
MILFSIFMFIFLNSEVQSNLQSAHVVYRNLKDMLFPIILTLSVMNILISAIIIGIFVLYASHKLAGPLYRFNAALNDISNKNLITVTSIRENDEFCECSKSLKQVSKVLINDFSVIKKFTRQIKEILNNGTGKENLLNKIEELEKVVNEYQL